MRNARDRESTRRQFLQTSAGVVAGAALSQMAAPAVHAAGNDAVKVALVGCGGRGGGALTNALTTKGPMQVVALADVFQDRVNAIRGPLKQRYGDRADVPEDSCFVGFDAYRKAVDALGPGGLVILATPPAFRPLHFEYAVERRCHVFMEKSFGVDPPGVRRIMKAGEAAAARNLKVAGGLMTRHNPAMVEAISRIHDGQIGPVITSWAYRMHEPVPFAPRQPGQSELAHQIRNYNCFTWLNGSFMLDWLIHDLDLCCWAKDAWPISAQGMGGRQTRTEPDQQFDHMAVEYQFADGTRMMAQGRHMAGCWGFFADLIHGGSGSALLGVVGDSSVRPCLYRGHIQNKASLVWQGEDPGNPYQIEFDHLLDAIRNNKAHNETERCAKACVTGIIGRMAFESGQLITWDQAVNSPSELAPGLDQMNWDSPAPARPDAQNSYPVARPGQTKPA